MIYSRIDISGVTVQDSFSFNLEKNTSQNKAASVFKGEINNYTGRNANVYSIGDSVEIFADLNINPPTTKIFNGLLEDITFEGEENRETMRIRGRDYSAIMQDRTVEPEVYTNLLAGSIVKDIINKYTSDITVNNVINSSTTIPRIAFNQIPVYDAISQLADLAGFTFYVDTNKDLHFEEKGTVSSNITLGSANVIASNFEERRDTVFNEIWVYGDRYLAETPRELFMAGATPGSVYTLIYPPHNTQVQTSNRTPGSNLKGGIFNMSFNTSVSGTDYLVNFFDKQIIFVSGTTIGYSTIPNANGSVLVNYNRSLPIVKVNQDDVSIAKYKKRVKIIQDKNIKDPDTAVQISQQMINENSKPSVQGDILVNGVLNITPGQTVVVNLPFEGINNETFEVISAKYDFNKLNMLKNEVLSVTINKRNPDFADMIKNIDVRLRKLEGQDISDADVLTRLLSATGSIGIRNSGITLLTNRSTGSVSYLYSTNFTPPRNPFNLASGTTQGIMAGSFTGSAQAYTDFAVVWSGGYVG